MTHEVCQGDARDDRIAFLERMLQIGTLILQDEKNRSKKRPKERDDALQELHVVKAALDHTVECLAIVTAREQGYLKNLTETQKRCSELIDQARQARALSRELALRPPRSTGHDEVLRSR